MLFAQYLDIVQCSGAACQYDKEAFRSPFQFTAPNVIPAARQPATRSVKVQVNYAFTCGLSFELEVRDRDEADELRANQHSEVSECLRELSVLRKRHPDLLGTGTSLDADPLSEPKQNLTATLNGNGDDRAVVVWNRTECAETANPELKELTINGSDDVDGSGSAVKVTLETQEVRGCLLGYDKGVRAR